MPRSSPGALRARICLGLCAVGFVAAPMRRALSQGTSNAGAGSGAVPAVGVRGTVMDPAGHAVVGAHVFVGAHWTATTDANGRFAVMGVAPGVLTVTVTRIGFRPSVSQWAVDSDTLALQLGLEPLPQELPAIHVAARAQPYDGRLAGFRERSTRGIGYFLTRDQLQRRSDHAMTDALRELPGVRVVPMRGALGTTVRLGGSRCSPLVFVDGFPASVGQFDLNQIDLQTVEGVEVYPNDTSVPAEFMTAGGGEQCGVIAIWAAPARPRSHVVEAENPVDVKELLAKHQVYLPDSVEDPATLVAGTIRVQYPDSLLRAGAHARLAASFVVDTSGSVELPTLTVTGQGTAKVPRAFVDAIRNALGSTQFAPARRSGRAVRQVVVLPFVFDPNNGGTDERAPPDSTSGALL